MPPSGYSGFLGIPLAHFAIRCRHGLEKWPACRNRIEALLSRLVVHGSFRGSHHGPLSNLCALLGVSLLFQSTAHIPSLPGIAYSFPPFLPCFILGYMCAFLASRLSALSISQSLGAILLLALEILSIHLFSFSKAKTLTVIFLFTLWCLPWITRKLRLTPLLTLLGTYSALMWLNHRFIFGYHFSWDLYGTQSISVVFIVTLVSSLLLAMAMQKLFNRMIPSNPQTQSKTL